MSRTAGDLSRRERVIARRERTGLLATPLPSVRCTPLPAAWSFVVLNAYADHHASRCINDIPVATAWSRSRSAIGWHNRCRRLDELPASTPLSSAGRGSGLGITRVSLPYANAARSHAPSAHRLLRACRGATF